MTKVGGVSDPRHGRSSSSPVFHAGNCSDANSVWWLAIMMTYAVMFAVGMMPLPAFADPSRSLTTATTITVGGRSSCSSFAFLPVVRIGGSREGEQRVSRYTSSLRQFRTPGEIFHRGKRWHCCCSRLNRSTGRISMVDSNYNNESSSSSEQPSARSSSSSSTATTTASTTTTTKKKDMSGLGRWEEMHGNYILRPSAAYDGQPRALLHFLGGALVGAAPHLSYRYLLERLSNSGYLVVATPYNLSFDHLDTCDSVIERFERIAPTLARQYGAVPVVGVGHSCGALLQLLITCLFPDTPRAGNALLSFNNKPVKEAVPLFDEFFAPFFTFVAGKNETYPSGTEAMGLALQLARVASEGDLPPDELLRDIAKFVTPQQLSSVAPTQDVSIPPSVRDALKTLIEPSAMALSSAGVLPLLNQIVDIAEQIPLLIDEVAEGARDFIPPPSSVRAAARRSYRARRTLVLQFDDDPLDESEEIEELLKEAETIMRMKRPMIRIDLQRKVLEGGHATPLLAPPLDVASRAEDILGVETARERLWYAQADATVGELIRWLEEGQL